MLLASPGASKELANSRWVVAVSHSRAISFPKSARERRSLLCRARGERDNSGEAPSSSAALGAH